MNSIMESYYPTFRMYQALRNQLLEVIRDEDLAYKVEDDLPTLGQLCREIGEIQHSYIQSFKTFQLDFDYQVEDSELEKSVKHLEAWYRELDHELEKVVSDLSQDQIDNRKVDRGGSFQLSPLIQLDVYKEALLIFYGKTSIYLLAMHKDLPEQWRTWIL